MRFAFVTFLLLALPAQAGELVHPFPPGGPVEVIGAARAGRTLRAMQRYAAPAFSDVLAAHVAATLASAADGRVDVSRRHRGGGSEARDYVARAHPDGRTFLFAPLPEAPGASLVTVAVVANMPYAWATHGESYARDLADLLKSGTTRLLIAHPGERTVAYRPLEGLRAAPGSRVEPLAYNGGLAALNALASGQVVAALVPLPAVLPYVGNGRIRLLAVADAKRHESLPEVPTSIEAGLRDSEAVVRFAVFVAPGTPEAALRRVTTSLSRVADDASARELFLDLGVRLGYSAR